MTIHPAFRELDAARRTHRNDDAHGRSFVTFSVQPAQNRTCDLTHTHTSCLWCDRLHAGVQRFYSRQQKKTDTLDIPDRF